MFFVKNGVHLQLRNTVIAHFCMHLPPNRNELPGMALPVLCLSAILLKIVYLYEERHIGSTIDFIKEETMVVSFTQLLIWIILAALVGVIGELLARRRTPDGIIGAIIVGLIAIFLIVGVFHFHIAGEPSLDGVPLISTIIAAAILVAIWSGFAYHRVRPYYARYYRRGSYVRPPRRRRWF
jgi:uncharacterized membrane protein YeaQ/YmgE (transglycosylase-associated protein family)